MQGHRPPQPAGLPLCCQAWAAEQAHLSDGRAHQGSDTGGDGHRDRSPDENARRRADAVRAAEARAEVAQRG
jgi:hypothetical protein